MSGEHEAAIKNEAPAPPEVSSLRLVATLAFAGAFAGLLLVFVYQATAPRIAAYKKLQQELAATEVLGGSERVAELQKLDFIGGAITLVPEGSEAAGTILFRGFDASGELVGYALPGGKFGYADVIEIMVGYAPHTKKLLGMKVLASRETPGLGDGIFKNQKYAGQFPGRDLPLVITKPGAASALNEVDTITGATISSAAVIKGINEAIANFADAIDTLESQTVSTK